MRIYYGFNIKNEFLELYRETPSVIYNILAQLYHMRKGDMDYGCNLFYQLVDNFDKEELDKNIFLELHNKMKYSKRKDEHIINNLYKDEISIMKIKRAYLVINCNKNCTEFFNILSQHNTNLFICDFINHDYFFAGNMKTLV